MKEILLPRGYVALVDDDDFLPLSAFTWRPLTMNHTGIVYAQRTITRNGRQTTISMHRQIMEASSGVVVDHKNGNGLDNRKSNLRIANQSQNTANGRKLAKGTSRFKGVCWDSDRMRWDTKIGVNGRCHRIGRYLSETDAAVAYDQAALHYFGEFARLNFPKSVSPKKISTSIHLSVTFTDGRNTVEEGR